jgi:hypothetical protein
MKTQFSWTYGNNTRSTLRFPSYTALALTSKNLQTRNFVWNCFQVPNYRPLTGNKTDAIDFIIQNFPNHKNSGAYQYATYIC